MGLDLGNFWKASLESKLPGSLRGLRMRIERVEGQGILVTRSPAAQGL